VRRWPHSPSLGLVTALVTLASGATLLTARIARVQADAGWVAAPISGLGLVLFALGLASALLDRWGHTRLLGALAALVGGAAALATLWSLEVASPMAFSPAWLWSPSLQSRIAVCLAGLGLLLAEETSTGMRRLGLLCLIGTVVGFISVNLALALALDFPEWVIGGSFAALALSPAEQRLLARELNDNLALALRSLGAAAAGLGLLLLAWNAERRAGYSWPRWFTPVALLLVIWVSVALAGALWALEESDRSRPDPAVASRASTPLPEMTLAFGVVTAALLAVALRQTRRAMEAAEQARLANRRLQDEIDERRQIQELLAERETRLRLVFEQVPAIVWTTDRDLRFTSANGAGLRALGMDDSSLLGNTVGSIVEDDAERSFLLERYQLALAGAPQEFEFTYSGRNYAMHLEPLRDLEGRIVGTIGVALDITERKRLEEQLRHLALHDPLTGLPNRFSLFHQLEQMLDIPLERAPRPFALLLLDLDGFKKVNDTLGHPAGDQLLIGVGQRLSRCVRSLDIVARLGGDEFIVLARGADERAALALAGRILRSLEEPIRIEGREVMIQTSIGSTTSALGYRDATSMLRDADIALYRAKAMGPGHAVVFEPGPGGLTGK
jgi:diguanylate cyclase (GGDEF)-like protein/PAS domain S-box-containing protein